MAESLPDTKPGETPAARIAREIADIDAELTPQIRLAFEMPARLGETGAHDGEAAAAAARRMVDSLLARLPELRERIFDDARAAWRNDPSCRHPIEALYAYPGVFAITRHRIAHIFYQREVPLLPRLIAEDAHRRTGIDINAGAQIGREFFIDHGTGVVIGETAVVGDRVTLYQGDPAARSVDEVLLCYPGVLAMIHHRLAHKLYTLGLPLLARIVAELAHAQTGIDIHPGARIGAGFFIDHGTGVVIGETAVIGQGVRVYQAVTLGAKRFPTDAEGHLQKGLPRHPVVEDEVVIYAGATILGRVTLGKGATIGGNVWVTDDVAPGASVTQASLQKAPGVRA